jgi:hypothetical protein
MVMEKDNKKRGNNPRLLSPLPDPLGRLLSMNRNARAICVD